MHLSRLSGVNSCFETYFSWDRGSLMSMLFVDNLETLENTILFRNLGEEQHWCFFFALFHEAVNISFGAISIVSDESSFHIVHLFFLRFREICCPQHISSLPFQREVWVFDHVDICTSNAQVSSWTNYTWLNMLWFYRMFCRLLISNHFDVIYFSRPIEWALLDDGHHVLMILMTTSWLNWISFWNYKFSG